MATTMSDPRKRRAPAAGSACRVPRLAQRDPTEILKLVSGPGQHTDPNGESGMRKWWPLTAVCLGAFILLVDVTIVNVALPSMVDDLDASFGSLQWVIDGYTLALAALLLASGSLADRFGHRRLYLYGLGLFGLASLLCSLAPTAAALIAARVAQGAGGAAMFATAPALLLASYQGRDRGTAFGVWGAANGGAAAAGPLLGGLLTEHLSWPAIFWVNLPIAAVAIAMTLRVVRADQPGKPSGF